MIEARQIAGPTGDLETVIFEHSGHVITEESQVRAAEAIAGMARHLVLGYGSESPAVAAGIDGPAQITGINAVFENGHKSNFEQICNSFFYFDQVHINNQSSGLRLSAQGHLLLVKNAKVMGLEVHKFTLPKKEKQ